MLLNIKTALATVVLVSHLAHAQSASSPEAPKIFEGLQSNVRIKGAPRELHSLEERMKFHKVPGVSIAFLQDHKVVWTYTAGVTDFESNQPIDENTVFQAASISKLVFATVLMKYREQHGLDLDANVNDLLTSWQLPPYEWEEKTPVTLRRLLSHSAGTTVHGFGGYASGEQVPSITALLDGSKPSNSGAVVVDLEPGTKYRYSGGGTTLAQLALQDKSGTPLPELAQRLIFKPLGMKHSQYAQPITGDLSKNAALPHYRSGKAVKGGAHTYVAMAAAGLWTTPSDLMRLAGAVQLSAKGSGQTLWSEETVSEMLTPQMSPVGIGFFLKGDGPITAFSHGGSNEGFRAQFFAHTETGDGIAIMTNGDNGSALMTEILNRVSEFYEWGDYQPILKGALPYSQEIQESLIGAYEITKPIQAVLEIGKSGKNLKINLPEHIVDVRFFVENDTSIFSKTGINMSVVRDENGKVKSLKFWGIEATKITE
ncbi:MAG: hypothetical protein COB37_03865 [Kordiimonadales bacterium]|nr:MAG: hypothetical protein COB37_03865 [Kordiimonadales bacterium]